MGLKGRLEAEVELRSSGDLFHEMLGKNPHHLSKAASDHIQGCELLEGEFGKVGSIVLWNFTLEGKPNVAKDLIEAIDEVNKIVRFKMIEGELLKDYKDLIVTAKVTPESGGLDLVKWTIEFDTIHEEARYPTFILDFLLNITRDIENHHLAA